MRHQEVKKTELQNMSRKTSKIFLVTYLPTILMNLINQAANYITGEDKYSMIYTINITCMMVLASIYLSVSSSLPSTASIKPVEVWLLVNLFYPLQVILTNVILQVSLSQLHYHNVDFNPFRPWRTKHLAGNFNSHNHIKLKSK